MANEVNYGRIALIPKGDFDDTVQYEVGDVVSFEGSSYICKFKPAIATAPTENNYWQVASQGSKYSYVNIKLADYEAREALYDADNTYIDPDSGLPFEDTMYNIYDDYETLARAAVGIQYDDNLNLGVDNVQDAIDSLGRVATPETPGLVKPDGSTITVDENGTIKAVGGSADKVTYTDNHSIGATNVQTALDINASNIAQLSNDNFIINPNFKINQRGFTSNPTNAQYTVDRWQAPSNTTFANLEVVDNGIKVTSTNSNTSANIIQQIIENPSRLCDKTVTFSVMVSDYTSNVPTEFLVRFAKADGAFLGQIYGKITGNGLFTMTGKIPSTINGSPVENISCVFRQPLEVDKGYVINWAKLEQGSIATPFVAPDPATELVKCQRYYYKLHSNNSPFFGSGMIYSATMAYIIHTHPIVMRTTPTMSYANTNNGLCIWTSTNINLPVTSLETFDVKSGSVCITVYTSENTSYVKGESTVLKIRNNECYIEFDAEIY